MLAPNLMSMRSCVEIEPTLLSLILIPIYIDVFHLKKYSIGYPLSYRLIDTE